jgi:hypothetical protein
MTLTCGALTDRGTTCPFCLGHACNACSREPEKPGELRICQHDSVERHQGIPAFEDEPVQNRTTTKPIPPIARPVARARIEIDFSKGDTLELITLFERIMTIVRRGGKLVLVEPER